MNLNIVKDLLRENVALQKEILEAITALSAKVDSMQKPVQNFGHKMAEIRAAKREVNTGEGGRG